MIRKYSTKEKGHTSNVCPFGARGGSRTRTPLRALAPEASESTNSTTRASASATEVIIPWKWAAVNTFFQFLFIFFIGPLAQRLASGHASAPIDFGKQKRRTRSSRVLLVREAGVEPARPCEHWHLKPASLPIPPLAQAVCHHSRKRCVARSDKRYITMGLLVCQQIFSKKRRFF